jgi:NAD(P)-dependent dehydrogenase (short-subunit alcohol dehydrogenase family)
MRDASWYENVGRRYEVYKDLSGKTALVTGSGKKTGIGYAIAEKLASCGANIVIADLGSLSHAHSEVKTASKKEMASIAAELKERFNIKSMAIEVDVTNGDLIHEMSSAVKAEFGRVDVLVNNAGASFGVPNSFLYYDESAWMKTIDVNLNSVFRVSRSVIPLMLPGSSIINTSSRAAKVPPLFNGAYAVAKAGVVMLTKVMAKELAPNIRVNAITPGQIETDLEHWRFGLEAKFFGCTAEERRQEMIKTIPLARIGSPGEVANLVAFLASSESSYMTGQAINITGGQLMEL